MRFWLVAIFMTFIMVAYQNCADVGFSKLEQKVGGDSVDCDPALDPDCDPDDGNDPDPTPTPEPTPRPPVTPKLEQALSKDSYASNYVFGDFNQDGKIDLIMGIRDLHLGEGSFTPENGVFGIRNDKICYDYYNVHFGDCENLSNQMDIPGTCVEFNDQTYCDTIDPFKNRNTRIEAEDFDNDGDLDILTFGQFRSYVHINDGIGNFSQSLVTFEMQGYCYYPYAKYIDVNGDGKKDFIFLSATNSGGGCAPSHSTHSDIKSLHIALRDGGGFTEVAEFSFEESSQEAMFDDFLTKILYFDSNGDGLKDLHVLAHTTQYTESHPSDYLRYRIYQLAANGAGFSDPVVLKEWFEHKDSYQGWESSDINQDGRKDILISHIKGELHSFQSLESGGYSSLQTDFGLVQTRAILFADENDDQIEELILVDNSAAHIWNVSTNSSSRSMPLLDSPLLLGSSKAYINPETNALEFLMGGYFEGRSISYGNAVWFDLSR